MKFINYIKWLFHSLKLLINPDGNIKSLIFIGDEIAKSKAAKIGAKKLFECTELYNMYIKKDGLEPIDLGELSSYPHDSLGFQLYVFYTDQNLDVYPMGRFSEYTQSQYIAERIRKIHDILHVVLGYGTDLTGEAKVNAYVLNQSRMPIPFLIVLGIGIKYLFKEPMQFHKPISEIEQGWKMGYRTDPFLTQDWDSLMKLPLNEVRRRFIYRPKVVSNRSYSIVKQSA